MLMNKRCHVNIPTTKQLIKPRKIYCKLKTEVLLQLPSLYLLHPHPKLHSESRPVPITSQAWL